MIIPLASNSEMLHVKFLYQASRSLLEFCSGLLNSTPLNSYFDLDSTLPSLSEVVLSIADVGFVSFDVELVSLFEGTTVSF